MIKIITLITLFCTTSLVLSGTGTVRTLSEAEKQRIVDNLNTFRNSVLVSPTPKVGSMRTISWDNTLENLARNYAAQCIWGHSLTTVNNGARPSTVGENLYMSATTSGILSTQSLIDNGHTSWQNERLFYTLSNNSCAAGKVCGHYTVIVKDVNNGVGCAIADCSVLDNYADNALYPNKFYMVCNYNGQNYNGVPPYTAETTSTAAPTTPAPTTLPPTASPGVLQELALKAFVLVNNYRATLNIPPFLQSPGAISFLRDFTIKRAENKVSFTDLQNQAYSGGFGSSTCYQTCYMTATTPCNEVDAFNFIPKNKINSTILKHLSIAYADSGKYRYWGVILSASSVPAPATVLEVSDTLEEESDD